MTGGYFSRCGYCSRCGVSWPPGTTHECRIKLTAPAVTHWDSPEGQTRSCPNCDALAVENAKLRAVVEAFRAWINHNGGPGEYPCDCDGDCDTAIELWRTATRALNALPPSDVEGTP